MEEKLKIKFLHQGITVEDLDASIKWYENVFDVTKTQDTVLEQLNCRMAMLENGDVQFELFQYLGDDGRPVPPERRESMSDLKTGGTKHVCYQVHMPTFFEEKVDKYNVDIDYGPGREGDNWIAFIKDPNGVLFELHDIGGYVREPHAFDNRKIVTKV